MHVDLGSVHTNLVEQSHMQVVHVPLGWGHAVANVAANVKLAHDHYTAPEDNPRLAHCKDLFICPLLAQRMPADYVALMDDTCNSLGVMMNDAQREIV
jgi:hypothetical protein